MEKRIFQTWKSTTDLPHQFRQWSQTWKDCHPEWEYVLWDDAENERFVRELYPQFLELYRSFPEPIFRADMVRYLFLHARGGLYADMDFECLKPFDSLIEQSGSDIILGRMGNDPDARDSIPNAIMVARVPKHPFWLHVMDRLRSNATRLMTPENVTGPVMLKEAVDSYDGKITLLEPRYFYPVGWTDAKSKKIIRRARAGETMDATTMFPDSYAVTYWSHVRGSRLMEWLRLAHDVARRALGM